MAACGSLQHIFENPLPENQTLVETLSQWNQIKPVNQIKEPSFVEMFGELHFKESSPSMRSSLSSLLGTSNENNKSLSKKLFPEAKNMEYKSCHKRSESFSSMNSESLQLCTERLGFESFDDVEDLKSDTNEDWQNRDYDNEIAGKHSSMENMLSEYKRSRTSVSTFPPPISCIGKGGKPLVCFMSYRQNGRFVLKEVRTPSQEILQAFREDGRLTLQFVQSNDDILETEEEEEEEEEEDDDDDYYEDNEFDEEKYEEEESGSIENTRDDESKTDTSKNKVEDDLQ